MEIVNTVDGNAAMLSLRGDFGDEAAPQFRAAVGTLDESVQALVLDFEGITFVTPLALMEILLAERTMKARGGSLSLLQVPRDVADVLQMNGLSGRWKILS